MTSPQPPQSFDSWLADRIIEILGKVNTLMTQSDALHNDITELKANVAKEIQQVIDALAAASANATELGQLRTAVSQAHTDLQTLNANLKADDPAAPATP